MAIKKIIAIASAKGGVGKSSITSAIALNMAKTSKVGILDADIYGPNQHILFNIEHLKPKVILKKDKKYLEPVVTKDIAINSMGFLLDETKVAIWRGPMLSGAIRQLMNSTLWGDLDYLFVDMPPGTGDAYLTVASEIKPDFALLVTTANKLAVHDIQKSIILFNKLDIKMMGFIGNNIANIQETNDFGSIKELGISHISSIPFNLDIYNSNLDNLPSCFDDISKSIEELV